MCTPVYVGMYVYVVVSVYGDVGDVVVVAVAV